MDRDQSQQSNAGRQFFTTAWTVIREAQALDSPDRVSVLGPMLCRYWKPLYAYFLSKCRSPHNAEELVQGFLQVILESDKILQVDPSQGRFRDWLVACARNFMLDQGRKSQTKKRRPEGGLISLQDLRATDGDPFEPAVYDDPDQAFLDAWRRDLLERALREVGLQCVREGRPLDFQVFAAYYLNTDSSQPTWKQIATRFALRDWKEAAHRAERIKGRLARAIRAEVRRHVESEDDVDREIRDLFD